LVIGVLNVTPDSFSDGGKYDQIERALRHVARMLEEGADGIDVGGESTRPQGARPVSLEEELARVGSVVDAIRMSFPDVLLSVDTSKSVVAARVLDAGAHAINDVSGFRFDARMADVVASRRAGVVLMHSRGTVSDMATYRHAEYAGDVVDAVIGELRRLVDSATAVGITRDAIVLDPGIGFSKRGEHSLRVLAELRRIASLGMPVMVGVSRKRFIGELSGVQIEAERVAGTIGANVMALAGGASLFRVHDVGPNRQALDVAWGVLQAGADPKPGGQSRSRVDSRSPIPDSRR
jgi:dihydropteroate synthase